MRIISWYVKGLGNLRKNTSIKKILKNFKASTVMIQEAKRSKWIGKGCGLFAGAGPKTGFFPQLKVLQVEC